MMTPINVPAYGSSAIRALNRLLLTVQLRLVMFLLNLRLPIVWVAIPTAADVVSSLGAKLLVYQVSDKYDVNEDSALSRAVIRDMDSSLKKRAAVVMYSGRKLFEEAEHRPPVFPRASGGLRAIRQLVPWNTCGYRGHSSARARIRRRRGLVHDGRCFD